MSRPVAKHRCDHTTGQSRGKVGPCGASALYRSTSGGVEVWRCKRHTPEAFRALEIARVERHRARIAEAAQKREALLREFALKTKRAETYPVLLAAVEAAAERLHGCHNSAAISAYETLTRALALCERKTRVD